MKNNNSLGAVWILLFITLKQYLSKQMAQQIKNVLDYTKHTRRPYYFTSKSIELMKYARNQIKISESMPN